MIKLNKITYYTNWTNDVFIILNNDKKEYHFYLKDKQLIYVLGKICFPIPEKEFNLKVIMSLISKFQNKNWFNMLSWKKEYTLFQIEINKKICEGVFTECNNYGKVKEIKND